MNTTDKIFTGIIVACLVVAFVAFTYLSLTDPDMAEEMIRVGVPFGEELVK